MANTGMASRPPEESVSPTNSNAIRVMVPKLRASWDRSSSVFSRRCTSKGAEMIKRSLADLSMRPDSVCSERSTADTKETIER